MWFAVQAVIFAAIHVINPGMQLFPAVNLVGFGLLFGLIHWYTDSIWLVGPSVLRAASSPPSPVSSDA